MSLAVLNPKRRAVCTGKAHLLKAGSPLPVGSTNGATDRIYLCAHAGMSMHPGLRTGDLLEIAPYGQRPVKAGDVILFIPPEGAPPHVHRVVDVRPEGISTRGDNCSRKDPWLLKTADITGRVTAAWRGRKRRRIKGGRKGRCRGFLLRSWNVLDRYLTMAAHPLYRRITQSGRARHWLPPGIKPRVIRLKAGAYGYLRLRLGPWIIGRYNERHHQWHIRRPFRLFVDVSSLPVARDVKTVSPKSGVK